MGNDAGSPAAAASRRRKRAPKAWKVETHRSCASSPSSAASRSRISPAALFVNVTQRTCHGMTPSSFTRCATRCTMTRVLPLPAPARTRSGPSPCSTASRWASLRPSRMGVSTVARYHNGMAPPVRIAALGGLGEIGMNCMALECDGKLAVVDCGVMFPNEPIGIDAILPDVSWIAERAAEVSAVFVTHGHEDHIGALPHLLRRVRAPVHVPAFAKGLLEARLREAGVEADLRVARPGDVRGEGGPITAEFVAVTHSIPDASAPALSTPQGLLFHTRD